jgi:ribose 5-phosphate isomerase RpiB
MRIAVVNETSAADRNAEIVAALQGRGHEVYNAGMQRSGEKPELTYLQTATLSALLLNAGRADLVVGGCGTGQGFLNAVLQFPGVCCGLLLGPLDAWLFAQINGGNCVSLALNQGYGWAADVNLRLLFDALFSVEPCRGYPEHRRASQAESRELLKGLSRSAHRPMAGIVGSMDGRILLPVLRYPGVAEILEPATMEDRELAMAIAGRLTE